MEKDPEPTILTQPYFILACLEPPAPKGTHHNSVVNALVVLKLAIDMELDVLYTVNKTFCGKATIKELSCHNWYL